MPSYRPRRALRPTAAVRVARITVPALVVGTLAAGVAVAAWPQQPSLSAVPASSTSAGVPAERAVPDRASRDQARSAPSVPADSPFSPNRVLKPGQADKGVAPKSSTKSSKKSAKPTVKAATKAKPAAPALDLTVVGSRYLTEDLNLRSEPEKDAKVLSVLETRSKVQITDTVEDGFRLIVRDRKARWVTDEFLAKKQPPKEAAISDESCDKNSSIEGGLQPNGIKVYRALCARFPNITAFGGRRPANGGFHPSGRAVDAMIDTDNGGWDVARWVRANASKLGASEVIHAQKIWTVQRSGEGWRSMSDMGNNTANHYDHVHISVY